MKAHFARTTLPIDLGDICVGESKLYIATKDGWSNCMHDFVQPQEMLGYPIAHWPLIAGLKLPSGSVNGAEMRALMPSFGAGTTMAIWIARLNAWKDLGMTPDTPIEMVMALGVWRDAGKESWHQLHQLILMYTRPAAALTPYTEHERSKLRWR